MPNEPTYEELKSQIADLKKQNELIQLNAKLNYAKHIQTEKALIESNRKFASLTDNIPAFIAYVDASSLKYEFVNNVFQKFFGVPTEKIIGSHIKEIIGENNYRFALKYIEEVINGKSTSYENVFNLTIGKRWNKVNYVPDFDENGNVKSIIVLTYDITERKKAEQELIESETKFREIINQINDGIVVVDEQGKIIIWNKGVEIMFGLKATEALNRNIAEIQCELALPQYKNLSLIESTMKDIYTFKNTKFFNRVLENDIIPYNSNNIKNIQSCIFPIKINDSYLFCSLFRDSTEKRNYEKQLLQINSDKDRFLSILAHDLKSPFNAILGFIELLKINIRKYNINTIEQQLDIIYKSSHNTYNLIEELLLWANSQNGKLSYNPQSLNFNQVCFEILEEIKHFAESKNISIIQTTKNDLHIFADIEMLKTILRNLVSNAIKFTNKSGEININAEQNHNNIIISISDNGIGIASDNIEKIFDITNKHSTRGTENESGTGLGLILCKEFVEKHNGKIWVESEPGIGTKFYFTLPIIENML